MISWQASTDIGGFSLYDTGVSNSLDTLYAAIDSRRKKGVGPPPPIGKELLFDIKHTPLFGWAIFNPFGPTISTITAAHGLPEKDLFLIRTDMHPGNFRSAVIGSIPWAQGFPRVLHYTAFEVLNYFLMGNGVNPHNAEYGWPFIEAVPTYVFVPYEHDPMIPRMAMSFRHGIRYQDLDFVTHTELARRHVNNLWEYASAQIDMALTSLCKCEQDDDTEKTKAADNQSQIGISQQGFEAWFDFSSSIEMRRAIRRDLPSAWNGAITHSTLNPECLTVEMLRWFEPFVTE
jgi:hypothetical protein